MHGMTGDGVVLPDEDVVAVRDRFAVFEGDLKPRNGVALVMAWRAAMLSVRMERCVREEAAATSKRMLSAGAEEEESRIRDLDGHFDALAEHPARSLRHLKRSPEGIDRLIAAWLALRADLVHENPRTWSPLSLGRLQNLQGQPCGPRREPPDPEERASLAAVIDEEIARLRDDREALDLPAIARSRAAVPTRAIFDPSREAERARKYEAAAERGFYKAIREVERINAAPAEADESDESPIPESISAEVASFAPPPDPEPEPEAEEPEPPPTRPSAPTFVPAPAIEGIPVYHRAEPVPYDPPVRE